MKTRETEEGRSRGAGARSHGGDKGGQSRVGAALEELSHARGHPGVHGCGAESVVANTVTGLAEGALSDGH